MCDLLWSSDCSWPYQLLMIKENLGNFFDLQMIIFLLEWLETLLGAFDRLYNESAIFASGIFECN